MNTLATSTAVRPDRLRRFVHATLLTAALAVGATALTQTAIADAQPPTGVQGACNDAGGDYTNTGTDGAGHVYEQCCTYRGWASVYGCDYYVDGTLYHSDNKAPTGTGTTPTPYRPPVAVKPMPAHQ